MSWNGSQIVTQGGECVGMEGESVWRERMSVGLVEVVSVWCWCVSGDDVCLVVVSVW